jgi:hypothetical protein
MAGHKQRGITEHNSLTAAILIIIVLAFSLVYTYASETSEISSLKESGRQVCESISAFIDPLETLIDNETIILHQQIQNDSAMIASLNSSQPSGYASLISTLSQEMSQDKYMLTLVDNVDQVDTSIGPSPCTVVFRG